MKEVKGAVTFTPVVRLSFISFKEKRRKKRDVAQSFDCIDQLSVFITGSSPHVTFHTLIAGWMLKVEGRGWRHAPHAHVQVSVMTPPTSTLRFREASVRGNGTEDASGSSFNKLQVNDTLGDQQRPRHGLHRSPFRVWFDVKLQEDLATRKNVQLEQRQERQEVTNQH